MTPAALFADYVAAFPETGKLQVGDEEYSLNEIFQQEAIQLSDDFDIDETMAAVLLLRGGNLSQELDRSSLQSAKFLYHTRRKNTLDSIRLIFFHVIEEKFEGPTRRLLVDALERLIAPGGAGDPTFMDRCITAMATVRKEVQMLRDKERHARTLGMAPDPILKEDLELQLRFLRNQHEMLSSIVYYLVKYKKGTVVEFRRLLGVLKGLERYDVFTAHHFLPVFAFISTLCGTDSNLTFEETIQLHKEHLNIYKENPWSLRYLQAAIMIWWLSEFNGLCSDPPPGHAPSMQSLDYNTDIVAPANLALKDGGLELIMGLAADMSPEPRLNAAKEDLHRFLQTRVPPVEDVSLIMTEFKSQLTGQLELFVDGFIANMANLLQTIKVTEEEDNIMDRRTYDYELERFFLVIHYVYDGRRDAGMAFWSDPESNLYGFLNWAAKNQTPFMVATFGYMLASISYGAECAEAAHRFLLDDSVAASNRNRRGESLTWNFIFKHVRIYLAELDKRKQALVPSPAYSRAPPPPAESAEPAAHLSMELDGMMRLTSQIISESPEARRWVEGNPDFNLLASLFDLLSLKASTQLWDSIFSTITALLADKTDVLGETVWNVLDNWALGPPPAPTPVGLQLGASTAVMAPFNQNSSENFDLIIRTVHPAEAFTRLLTRLVEPAAGVAFLKDSLPFPEGLGSSNRKTGMEPYVDFIMATIFANTTSKNLPRDLPPVTDREESVSDKLSRAHYRRFRPALQLSCLQFIYACLSGFNDDLLDMAHKGLSVDDGMRSSSLLAYAKLHPFGRVMEHILTEKCLNVLFEILQLGSEDLLGATDPPASVIEAVLYTIMILELAIQMQPTYFRVVRPFIKQDEGIRRTAITGNGFERLEKAVHYRLDTIVYLGLYVGARQQEIVLASIKLLERFNVSPDFVASTESTYGRQAPINRALGAVEQSEDSRRIVFNFIQQWDFPDELQLDNGQFPLKMPVLQFLDNTLAAQPNAYTLAHMILGFGYDQRSGIQLSVAPGGVGTGVSLMHHIINAALDTREAGPIDGVGETLYVAAYCELKNACFSVLSRLWSSPSTSSDVLYILRANKFFYEGFSAEAAISPSTLWGTEYNYSPIEPTREFFGFGATSFCDFMKRRTALFEYTALEIRQLTTQGAATEIQRYLSSLLGSTVLPDRGAVSNVHILDLLDFLEFIFPGRTSPPKLEFLSDASSSLSIFQEEDDSGVLLFNLLKVSEFLQIRKGAMRKLGALTPELEQHVDLEIDTIDNHLFCENQLRRCRNGRLRCLKSWADLVKMMLEDCEMERASKTGFVLQALQAILPKLELFSMEDIDAAEVFSSLAHSLISHLNFDAATFGTGRGSDLANDRLYQLFRASLKCMQSSLATANLREDLYNVALRYLNGMAAVRGSAPDTRRNTTQTVRASGDKLLEVICNDAYAGEGECKIVSLLLLESLAAVAAEEGSAYVVEALVRQNFLVVLVDSIKSIGSDLQNSRAEGIP